MPVEEALGGLPRAVEGPEPPGRRDPAWARLGAEIEACRACPLGRSRRHVVVYRGSARPLALFVGEAPGAEEDRLGVPFVGRSGRRLDAAVVRAGLTPSEFGVVNLVKCRPPENRFRRDAAEACRPFLDRQVELLRPRLLVTLGAHALAALDPGAPKVTACAGTERRAGGRTLFPLLHPAAPLHDPRQRGRWESDLDRLREVVGRLRDETS